MPIGKVADAAKGLSDINTVSMLEMAAVTDGSLVVSSIMRHTCYHNIIVTYILVYILTS